MSNETTKQILRYTLTPQIVPRAQQLFFSGFTFVAYFMAQIFRSARLLPSGHAYLSPSNVGRYGIRHVIAEAALNLKFNRQNIDQVIIFMLLLVGTVILFAQIGILILSMASQVAYAQIGLGPAAVPMTFTDYFLVADATHDVAFVLLDRVFGLDGFFTDAGGGTTCVQQNIACFDIGQSTRVMTPDRTFYTKVGVAGNALVKAGPTTIPFPFPYHVALHSMFEVYSLGILVVAVFIFTYFVIAVVAETAQSGTPFGRRFNHVWAPLRLIAAIGMLVPLNSTYADGLNSGQYILMFAAKWGSGFASNGWELFVNTAVTGGGTPLGTTDTLVADPETPQVNTLVEFFTIVAACKRSYEMMYHERVERPIPVEIDAWLVNANTPAIAPMLFDGTDLYDALDYFDRGDVIIVFGEYNDAFHQTHAGSVKPYCGQIIFQLSNVDDATEPGAFNMLYDYYVLLGTLWLDAWDAGTAACGCAYAAGVWNFGCIGANLSCRYLPIDNLPAANLPNPGILESIRAEYQNYLDIVVDNAVLSQQGSPEWAEQLTQLGWGGAAIWYNKVAQLNGSLIGAVYSMPAIQTYPDIMESIRTQKASADSDAPGIARHQLYQGPDAPIELNDEEEEAIARVLFATQQLWDDHYSEKQETGNIWHEVMNTLFGTQGLFDLQHNADLNIHPLAQLTAVGRTIIDTAIRNLGFSAAAGLGGGIINLFSDHLAGRIASTASDFLGKIAVIGLTIGFVLFYVIPFLPFIYFFFAVGAWIKTIFEAMVGVPLWALAHIRIDGNGLPGDAGINGYYLILEIFVRPMLIVFGLLASITIFSAQVTVLNQIWSVVVSNVTGFAEGNAGGYDVNQTGGLRFLRGAVDEFFFTVIYAIVIYMLGMASFKMIDLVPNHILRWMGASVSSFGDQSGDPAENLVRNSFIGSNMVSSPLGQGLSQGKQAISSGADAVKQLTERN